MTHREWASRPDLIAEFSTLLYHPTMQLALSVCTEVGLPRTKFPANAPNLIENHALANAKHEGYFEFLRNLKTLAQEKTPGVDPEALVPWKHASKNLSADE